MRQSLAQATMAREDLKMEQASLVDDARIEPSSSISLCEALDWVLHKGVALRGDIVLSVADVDLVYLGLQLLLCSTDTARRAGIVLPAGAAGGVLGGQGRRDGNGLLEARSEPVVARADSPGAPPSPRDGRAGRPSPA
ncbi:gas vesicle protein [Hyalangium sp.]|uniref:gas vesicle protein n=1 Tax=Hyalangium sp. TaxID=2028555 RepID=UPI002D29871A|nr:gas vesicle protein [Hyalangium sp.]HYH97732.1 gas vesicle protein [Hyalangium sp.]